MAVAGPEAGSSTGINNMASGFSRICRTCAACTDCLMPIFSGEGLLNNLADKIQRHLPIQVSEWDRLPQQLCAQCASTLLAWHELVKCCSQADVALRTRLQRIQELAGEETVPTTSGLSSTSLNIPREQSEQIVKSEWKGIDFRRYLEGILLNYIDVASQNARRVDAVTANIIYACQKCEKYSPFHTVEALAEHLEQVHIHEIPDEAGVAHFVTENLILVETLDESLDDKSVIVAAEVKADAEVAPVRARRRPDATDESLDKLCCPFCQKIFSAPKRLIVHLSIHPEVSVEGGFECRCCAVACADARALVEHLQRAHVTVEMEGTQQVCRSCGFVCSTTPDLRHHVRTFHAAVSSQPLKPAPSADPRVSPTNPKYIPVECPVCARTVSNKYNLTAHMRRHARQTDSFACGECGRAYRSRGSLKWHKETVHLGILRYICPECGEAFPSKMYRDVHRRIHSGETPFECESCGKSFRSKNSLVAHVKSHLGIRNYPCPRCPKRFQKSTHLNYHLRSHERKDLKKKHSTELKANP